MHNDTTPTNRPVTPGQLLLKLRQAVTAKQNLDAAAREVVLATPSLMEMTRGPDGELGLTTLAVDLQVLRALFHADYDLCVEGDPRFGWGSGVAILLASLDQGVRIAVQEASAAKTHATRTWNMLQCLMMVVGRKLGIEMAQLEAEMLAAQNTLVEDAKRTQQAHALASLSVVQGGKGEVNS